MADPWVLTEEQSAKARAHISKHLGETGCWICGNMNWTFLIKLTGEKPFDPEAEYVAVSDSAPKLRITCTTCGNIVYFSAEVMGLLDKEVRKDE